LLKARQHGRELGVDDVDADVGVEQDHGLIIPLLGVRLLAGEHKAGLKSGQPGLQRLPGVVCRQQQYAVAKVLHHDFSAGEAIFLGSRTSWLRPD
jgi:hypothetical protein